MAEDRAVHNPKETERAESYGPRQKPPVAIRRHLARAVRWIQALPYRGSGRFCPVCERPSRRFMSHGDPPRREAKCPHCHSLERHRLAWLYLKTRTDLFDDEAKRVLHFAPERCIEPRLRDALGPGYVTADLVSKTVDVTIDVTEIGYPDNDFDVIICSHVLEHVPDDRKAMRELARVLSDDGWILFMVPIRGQHTHEDPGIVGPAERVEHFGQADHVRFYGEDFTDRLRESGYAVMSLSTHDVVDSDDQPRLGLADHPQRLFVGTRRTGTPTG